MIFANGEQIELISCGVGVDGIMVGVEVAGKVGVTKGREIVGDGVDVIGDSEHALKKRKRAKVEKILILCMSGYCMNLASM